MNPHRNVSGKVGWALVSHRKERANNANWSCFEPLLFIHKVFTLLMNVADAELGRDWCNTRMVEWLHSYIVT